MCMLLSTRIFKQPFCFFGLDRNDLKGGLVGNAMSQKISKVPDHINALVQRRGDRFGAVGLAQKRVNLVY